MADNTNLYFGENVWPANTGDWKADSRADGTAVYWKSLGKWDAAKPVYPTLWWEP